MDSYTVYRHVSPNGKVYIGITGRNPVKRWRGGAGYMTNEYFARAIIKYGWDNFTHEILFTDLSKEEAEQKEIELIALHCSNERDYGYNIQSGGNSIGKHAEETKQKISSSNKGRKPWICGQHQSESTKAKIARSQTGKRLSEKTRQKISAAHKGRKQDKTAVKKRAKSCQKQVRCMETGTIFPSVKAASQFAGVPSPSVSACLKGKTRTAGGYHWEYAQTI